MIYTPPNTRTLESIGKQQIRLGIQGYGNTGKTWVSLSFPNPVLLNLNRGAGAHMGRKDIIEVPFYDPNFIKTIYPTAPNNRKDALERWLDTEGMKLTEEQTCVVDCNTDIQSNYDQWVRDNGTLFVSSKTGKYDDRAPWSKKLEYYDRITSLIKMMKCDIIFICHETEARNKEGDLNGKLRPLMSGAFGDQLYQHFTDFFRQLSMDKPSDDKLTDEKLKHWGMSKTEFKAMMNTFSGNTLYYWQTEGDDLFDAKRSSLVGAPRYIPASYQSFQKYMRKVTTNV